jgi:23S rRNA (cytidine1920-2'-O)/16S rRNA (cytidine1409-2'-O)-methyltransferase
MARPPGLVAVERLLVRLGHAASLPEAAALLDAGHVRVDGLPVRRGARVRPGRELTVGARGVRWVSRGAHKLIGALDAFGVDPAGRVTADIGASTGGFTQVLLTRGAARVFAVDVGAGLLDWSLRNDPRVVVLEGTHVRALEALPEAPSLLTADVSFISLRQVLPVLFRLLAPGGDAVVLVKPQFEVRADALEVGGRVRDEGERQRAIEAARGAAAGSGFEVCAGADAVITGARSGNREHFLWLRRPM